jgi:hypothetical protein
VTPMTALDWILGLSDWVHLGLSVAVWVVTAGVVIRWWESGVNGEPARGEAWFFALGVGCLAGLMWPWLLCFGLPVALGLGGVWGLAWLVAHPPALPTRRRPPSVEVHWADALPPDATLDQVIAEAERRAIRGDRP